MTRKNEHHQQKDPEPDKTAGSSDHHHSSKDDDATPATASSNGQQQPKLATISQVFSFGKGFQTKLLLALGAMFAAISGAVAVGMVFYFTKSYSDLSADATTDGTLQLYW